MSEAVLVDLNLGCSCPGATPPPPLDRLSPDSHVFLLCGETVRDTGGLAAALEGSCRAVRVLDSGSTAEQLYRFKQAVDRLDLSSVHVVTSARGREVLVRYQQLLFTALYTFDYRLRPEKELTCPAWAGSAHTDSPVEAAREEVAAFMQQLPSLMGDIRVLRSTLIPDCFGHGFSSRTGGVSDLPTLSSLNLFSSSRRRDPPAVVTENRRRLALHAGFHPQELRLLKVNHASDVWVLGEEEPPSYDAMVTNRAGLVLATPGADCMTLLFADPVLKVIGVAHAGWKGTLMGVATATVDAMVTAFGCRASDMVVAVGPSVGPCCFTLDQDHTQDFSRIHPDCVPDPDSARPHVDIRLANRVLLQNGGVLPDHIHDHTVGSRPGVTPCTSCNPQHFFSHVRDGPNFGTQVGFLWIGEAAGAEPEFQKGAEPVGRQEAEPESLKGGVLAFGEPNAGVSELFFRGPKTETYMGGGSNPGT